MTVRLHVDMPLAEGQTLALPPGPARHVQVRRLQPGDAVLLFNGHGGEWTAKVVRIGRSEVDVRVGTNDPVDRELPVAATLAFGMPANERMDALIEKATELGVTAIQPLVCERSVLRLAGERAEKKRAHWQAVAVAACEQCGRTRVPAIEPVCAFGDWLPRACDTSPMRLVLSLRCAVPLPVGVATASAVVVLSGPEGGLTDGEEAAAHRAGFMPVSLGPRVLRSDTAPLALLALLGAAR